MIQATYTGTDGSTWDLRNIAQDGRSVFLTDGGLMGLGHGEFDWFTQSGPITAGQRLTGFRSKERKVVLPVMIGVNLPEDQFLELSRRWWRANLPGQYGTLAITTSDGVSRSIRMRFQDDGNRSFEDDPTDEGSDTYVVTYIADFPFWTSPLVRSSYGTDAGQDFYNSSANIYRSWSGTANASSSLETSSTGTRTNYGTDTSRRSAINGAVLKTGVSWSDRVWDSVDSGANGINNPVRWSLNGLGIAAKTNIAVTMRIGNPTAAAISYAMDVGDAANSTPITGSLAAGAETVIGPMYGAPPADGVYQFVDIATTSNNGALLFREVIIETGVTSPGKYFDGNTPTTYGAPPFTISSSSRVVDATIANTGDVPAWGIYTFRGPFDAWMLKVNGGTVGSYAIATGDTLVLNTNPDVQSAILTRANGTVVDVTADLPNIDWRPIPVGASVPLQLSFTGTGTIDVDLPALYYRGF